MSMSGQSVELPIPNDLPPEEMSKRELKRQLRLQEAKTKLSSPWASAAAIILALAWTVPTFGLLVTSFRPKAEIDSSGWWTFFTNPNVTLDNYKQAFAAGLGPAFLNSFVITIPAVIIPITLALFAAYAFAWIDFRGRDALFVMIFALQIVPLQVAILPLLKLFVSVNLANSFWLSGSRTRSSVCRWRSSSCTTS